MNTLNFLWNACAQNLDFLYNYIESKEVKDALKFYPQISEKIKILTSNTTKTLYGIQGFMIMKRSDEEDDRSAKIIQFQNWQKQATVCGV